MFARVGRTAKIFNADRDQDDDSADQDRKPELSAQSNQAAQDAYHSAADARCDGTTHRPMLGDEPVAGQPA